MKAEDFNKKRQKKRAFILAGIFLFGILVNLGLSVSLGVKTGLWQQFARAGSVFVFLVLTIIAIFSFRHDKIAQGIWLLIVGFLITSISTSVLLAGFGLVISASIFLFITLIASPFLPQRQKTFAILLGVLSASVTFGLDLINIPFRLATSTNLRTPIFSIAIIVLLLTSIFFIQTAFRNYLMRGKIIVALLTSSILTFLFFASFFYISGSYTSLEEQIIDTQRHQLDSYINSIEQDMDLAEVDILYLSETTRIANYIQAINNNTGRQEIALLQEEIDLDLLIFAKSHPNYAQIRFIDKRGQEISRVDTDKQGNTTIAPLYDLQNKSDRYYFMDSISLPKGDIYVSKLDLNIEHGEIEIPHNPMIRLATPIIINNQLFGEIVLNLYAEDFLAPLGKEKPYAFLVDRDGYYLYHPDENKRWGRDLDTNININNDFPELSTQLFLNEAGSLRASDLLFTYDAITLSGETAPRWYIASYIPQEEAFAPIRKIRDISVLFFIVTLIIVSIISIPISQSISKPLNLLTNTALKVTDGNLDIKATVESKDEIGILAVAFNSMTAQLRELIDSLEERIAERTLALEKRSSYLEIAAKASYSISTMTQFDDIIQTSVDIIQKDFDLYYVGLFLIDKTNEWAELKSGTGKAGKIMLQKSHKIKIGEGMIGWCIANAEARIALDVGEDAVRFENPLLPETHSEGALPLRSRGRVLGAITIQSSQPAAFDKELINTLQTMADQIAVALDNAELFTKSETALKAEREAYGELSQEDWQALLRRQHIPSYLSDAPNSVYPVRYQQPEEITQALQEGQVLKDDELTAIIPIKVRGHLLGGVKLRKEKEQGIWTKDQLELAKTLAEQISISLESARLFNQSQRRVARERIIGDASARMRETLSIESVLQTAAEELHKALGGMETKVWLDKNQAGNEKNND